MRTLPIDTYVFYHKTYLLVSVNVFLNDDNLCMQYFVE